MEDFLFRLGVAVIPFILLAIGAVTAVDIARTRRLRRRIRRRVYVGIAVGSRPAGRHFVHFP